jgi:hypothetical protein
MVEKEKTDFGGCPSALRALLSTRTLPAGCARPAVSNGALFITQKQDRTGLLLASTSHQSRLGAYNWLPSGRAGQPGNRFMLRPALYWAYWALTTRRSLTTSAISFLILPHLAKFPRSFAEQSQIHLQLIAEGHRAKLLTRCRGRTAVTLVTDSHVYAVPVLAARLSR